MDMSMQQHGFGDDWDQSRRNEKVAGRSLDLDDIWMTSEFEGGNGMDMGRIGPDTISCAASLTRASTASAASLTTSASRCGTRCRWPGRW